MCLSSQSPWAPGSTFEIPEIPAIRFLLSPGLLEITSVFNLPPSDPRQASLGLRGGWTQDALGPQAAFQPVFTFPDFLFHGTSGPRAVALSSFLSHPLPSLECQGCPCVQIVPSPPFLVHIPELPGL